MNDITPPVVAPITKILQGTGETFTMSYEPLTRTITIKEADGTIHQSQGSDMKFTSNKGRKYQLAETDLSP